MPAGTEGKRNWPEASDVAVRTAFVSLLVIVTVAFGTSAPVGSDTEPETEPVSVCATRAEVEREARASGATKTRSVTRRARWDDKENGRKITSR